MAKKKFLERRRQARMAECRQAVDSHAKVPEIVEFISRFDLKTHVHHGGEDSYSGFEICPDYSESYDWIEVLNSEGGKAIEIAVYGGWQIVGKEAFQNYTPTTSGFSFLLKDIESFVRGNAVLVNVQVNGRSMTTGMVCKADLDAADWVKLVEQIVSFDYSWSDEEWGADGSRRRGKLQEYSRLLNRDGGLIVVEGWDRADNRTIAIPSGTSFDYGVHSRMGKGWHMASRGKTGRRYLN